MSDENEAKATHKENILSIFGGISINELDVAYELPYCDLATQTFEANENLTKMLYAEFSELVGCNDRALIRKAIETTFLGSHKNESLDFSKVDDSSTLQEEIVSLVLFAWAHHKNNPERFSLYPQRCYDGLKANVVLSKKGLPSGVSGVWGQSKWTKYDDNTIIHSSRHQQFEAVYNYFLDLLGKGVVGIDCNCGDVTLSKINYKSLQSLFNKCYVRRGQLKQPIVGDIIRNTMYVPDHETLKEIVDFFQNKFKRNFNANINDSS